MKDIDLLRSLLVQGLLDTEIPKEKQDFKAWISSGQYIVRSMPSASQIELVINNDYAFNHMLAFDSCRMASAAFETMENVQAVPRLPQSYGWIAIKCYYASFFAAHSIMRSFGYTCNQLEKGHINLLNDYGLVLGLSPSIKPEAGFFAGRYDHATTTLELAKKNKTHEDTWYWLVKCLEMLSQKVLYVSGVTSKKQALSAAIDDLINHLKDGGRFSKGNYLSHFRNAVNYRQEFHSWHPYGKNSVKSEKIISLISSWQSNEIQVLAGWKESKDAYRFFSTCAEVVNLSYLLMNLILDNSTNRHNLYRRWPNKLLNMLRTGDSQIC